MENVYLGDSTDPFSNLWLLLIIFLILLGICLYNSGCVQVDNTGFRAGIIEDSDSDDGEVEVHQRSCTGISILW